MTLKALPAAAHRIAAALTAGLMAFTALPALAQDAAAPAADAGANTNAEGLLYGQPTNWGIDLQPAASPMKEKMHYFHDGLLMPIITAIVLFVLALLVIVVFRFRAAKNPTASRTTHNTMLEVVWTLVPVIILVAIVIPSMKMLYYVDRAKNPEMTLKVTGHQWYWSYSYPDNGDFGFDANMVQDKDLKEGQPRLLATDNAVVLPVDTDIRILVTADDVIHSWAMPAFGVKTDAVPGRTNETWARIDRPGIYYGQCSEICGINHGFMPIEVHAVSKEEFANWVKAQGGTMPAPKAADADADGADGTAAAATPEAAPAAEGDKAAAGKAEGDKAAADKPAAPAAEAHDAKPAAKTE